ncbi:hypothetical protein MPS_0831 [Mycobacterium pseudoshottsii JCM 15466]|nr:hypothetical protein MMSP_0778 [Mycobacterium sp. 012931]GAQ32451.1 hypothetical protein MPS_0831 [Mycobacterium pseudoshottsii JCM 15466]
MQECQLIFRRHQQQAVRLGLLAGDFGQKLRPRHADGDGQPDPPAYVFPQPRRDLHRCARDPAQAGHIEKRLIHRKRLHQWSAVAEHLEHGITGPHVGAHTRRHHHGLRAQPPRLSSVHRGADPVCLGLIARRQHDTAADDHRPTPQRGVVTLLDGRVERIQVRVQDGGIAVHEHMFAPRTDKFLVSEPRRRCC